MTTNEANEAIEVTEGVLDTSVFEFDVPTVDLVMKEYLVNLVFNVDGGLVFINFVISNREEKTSKKSISKALSKAIKEIYNMDITCAEEEHPDADMYGEIDFFQSRVIVRHVLNSAVVEANGGEYTFPVMGTSLHSFMELCKSMKSDLDVPEHPDWDEYITTYFESLYSDEEKEELIQKEKEYQAGLIPFYGVLTEM